MRLTTLLTPSNSILVDCCDCPVVEWIMENATLISTRPICHLPYKYIKVAGNQVLLLDRTPRSMRTKHTGAVQAQIFSYFRILNSYVNLIIVERQWRFTHAQQCPSAIQLLCVCLPRTHSSFHFGSPDDTIYSTSSFSCSSVTHCTSRPCIWFCCSALNLYVRARLFQGFYLLLRAHHSLEFHT